VELRLARSLKCTRRKNSSSHLESRYDYALSELLKQSMDHRNQGLDFQKGKCTEEGDLSPKSGAANEPRPRMQGPKRG